jgi:hypothetical protein
MAGVDAPQVAELLQRSMAEGQKPYVTITSGSMAPLFRPGDQIQLEQVDAGQLRRGDVITLGGENAFLTHRYWGVVEVSGEARLLTRGDRLLAFDSPHSPSRLIGRVIARRRDGRRLSLETGPGSWLHRRLVSLGALEVILFTSPPGGPVRPPLPRFPFSATFMSRVHQPLPSRLLRRLLWAWASILAGAAGGLARLLR